MTLPPYIVPDDTSPGMYRLRLPDGRLTDKASLSWIKDAARLLLGKSREEVGA